MYVTRGYAYNTKANVSHYELHVCTLFGNVAPETFLMHGCDMTSGFGRSINSQKHNIWNTRICSLITNTNYCCTASHEFLWYSW